MNPTQILRKTLIIDKCKPQIDPYDFALILKKDILESNLSIRQYSQTLGKNHSTILDWLKPLNLTRKKYKINIKTKGKTITYRELRHSKKWIPFDKRIKEFHEKIRQNIKDKDQTTQTITLLKELSNDINRLIMHLEKNNKKTTYSNIKTGLTI